VASRVWPSRALCKRGVAGSSPARSISIHAGLGDSVSLRIVQHTQKAESKRAAQTMSGAGVRPAPQNDAEAYVAKLYEFARNEARYGR